MKHPKKQSQGPQGNFAPPLRFLPMLARALRPYESLSHPRAHSGEGGEEEWEEEVSPIRILR